jgi:hypothetical protein
VLAAVCWTAVTSGNRLSPLFGNTLSAAGLTTSGLHPRAIALDEATLAALVGLGLGGALTLVLASVEAIRSAQAPLGLPLSTRLLALSSLGVLVLTLGYGPVGAPINGVYDRYLLPVLPGLLAVLGLAVHRQRAAGPVLLCAVLAFAGWSVPWQQEYMQRQTAVWSVAEQLVADGIAPEQIDAGYEWAGWTRGETVVAQARDTALSLGEPRQFVQLVVDGLYRPEGWYVGFGPLGWGCAGRPLVEVPYGNGQTAYGLRRCRPARERPSP